MNDIVHVLEKYRGKRVFVTGHTGFKGTWLCFILLKLGAKVCGYSLPPETAFFEMSEIAKNPNMRSEIGDVRDFDKLSHVFSDFSPEYVFHLAAQPIVRKSYEIPRDTYEINVMGTVNLLECVRYNNSVVSVVNITTDKVYSNKEWIWSYRENDTLDGFDPYSNSKSCSELVTNCYKKSFFNKCGRRLAISTVRAGNVLGGGDESVDRIIPDCIRAVKNGDTIVVRNPNSVRPYQHVIEPLTVYLFIAMLQSEHIEIQGCYNVGPDESNCVTTGDLVNIFCTLWGETAHWKSNGEVSELHEANFLKLDCALLKNTLGWKPKWDIKECMEQVVAYWKSEIKGCSIPEEMQREVDLYFHGKNI